MAGLENDRQAEYVRILQIALEDAWRAALNLDEPNQRKILVYELAMAKAYASVLTPVTANDAAKPKAALKAHEVGEHLKDGTVVIAVDLEHNEALFAPEGIFGGNAKFDYQDEVVEKVKAGNGTHGHKDWRRITDAEGKTLSDVWNKVAPPALKGSAAPWFWLASPDNYYGRVRRGGEAGWYYGGRYSSLPVPVVRSGPARS